LTSDFDQAGANKAVNLVFDIVNEELCRLAKVSGEIDTSKVYIGGKSFGSVLASAALVRQSEFLWSPLGGVFGFIGAVPTLWNKPSTYETGPGSDYPQPSET
jgi:hypothetical protein